ncbi:MAG: hypothetical protein ACO258_12135, partial [Burkholderiaceae bacterium]
MSASPHPLAASVAAAPGSPAGDEPATHTGPVRRFKDPHYAEVEPTLGELRGRIDALDAQIV